MLRVCLVVAVAAACVYCSGPGTARRPHTSLEVGGGAAQAYHRTYGCHGELTHHEAQRQNWGAIGIEHEGQTGLLLSGQVGAGHLQVQEVSAGAARPSANAQVESAYWNSAAGAAVGWTLGFGSAELGGSVLPDLKTAMPFLRLRAGNLSQGLSFEGKVGTMAPLDDPMLIGVGGRLVLGDAVVRGMGGWMARPLRSHLETGGVFFADRTVWGGYRNGGDFGALLSAEIAVDQAVAVRFEAVAAAAWGANVWLRWNMSSEPAVPAKGSYPRFANPSPVYPAYDAPNPPTATAVPALDRATP